MHFGQLPILLSLSITACGLPQSQATLARKWQAQPAQSPIGSASKETVSLERINFDRIKVSSGAIGPIGDDLLAIRCAEVRAEVGRAPRIAAEMDFVYRGPTADVTALRSGELRRQIGLKLRALNTCNLVYVMWHIEPTRGIHVSVKSNPDVSTHGACGDRGYRTIEPNWSDTELAPIRVGLQRRLFARIDADQLRVAVDGRLVWTGQLPATALAFDGPVGLRSDNGMFDVGFRASPGLP